MSLSKREKVLLASLGLAGTLYLLTRTTVGEKAVANITDLIASVITGHEGDVLHAYQDEAGIWTIGKGHKILATDRVRGQAIYPFGPIQSITQAESDAFFERDTAGARNAVSSNVSVPINTNQRAALASLVFNIGAAAFAGSTLLKLLNAGDYVKAADQFLVWNKVTKNGVKVVSDGLTNRRARERMLFLS